jgi:hypothetical protein
MVFYRLAIYAKLKELQVLGRRDTIEARYCGEAEGILREYEVE